MEKRFNLTISFLALLARSSVYKVIAVLAVMTAAEAGLFFSQRYSDGSVADDFYNRLIFFVFLTALGTVYFLLMKTQDTMGDRGQDTLRRLKISERRIFLSEACYNLICLMLVFVVQIWLSIWMVCSFGKATSHHLFLTFYRLEFLHCLLPMAETGKWVRNILLLLAFSVGAACGCRKRDYVLSVLIFLVTVAWFVRPIGWGFPDLACCILYIAEIITGLLHMRET
ncbi:MAG: hypothetical protein K2P87_15585 [Lachnospiraceae bacterium]|nr:hypothetical protein [Lachnospiraceae bacterium]